MIKKTIWLILLFSFVGFHTYSDSNYNFYNSYYDFNNEQIRDSLISSKKPIAIVGDLQKTSIWEILIGREQNNAERNKIIKNISDENLSALITLGDMVFYGADGDNWKSFDELISPLFDKKIPVFPVLGNHEYWGNNTRALNNLKARFLKFEEKTWYTKKYGNTVLIFLDSNKPDISSLKWYNEKKWFENILNFYDNDSSVKGIVVFIHHSPFSNSLLTGNNENVINDFVPAFTNSKKTLALISGHAHTYERFKIKNKTFIISGGGGGPRINLKVGKDCYNDFCKLPSPRPFNYLLLNENESGIKITAKGLKKGSSKFFILDEVNLQYN